MNKSFLLVSLALFITACSGGGGNYYGGSEGIRMTLEPGSPPFEFYYFNPAFLQQGGGSENMFDIIIDLENKGASWAKGGIYVTGQTPQYVYVEGMRALGGPWYSCVWGNVGVVNGDWNFDFHCDGLGSGYYQDNDNWWASANLGSLLDVVGVSDNVHGSEDNAWWENIADGITVSGGMMNGESQIGMNFGLFDATQLNRGKLLLMLSENPSFNIDFDRNGVGYEYVLQGDNQDYPGGEQDIVVIPVRINDFPLGRDDLRQEFLITNCYLYTTYSSPYICVDPVPYSEGRKVCTQEQVDQPSSQGAPVSITIQDVKNSRASTSFSIEVANIGNGDVFNFGSAEKCNPFAPAGARVTSADKDVIVLGMVRVGAEEIKCNSRIIRLDPSGTGRVTCTYFHENRYSSTSGTPVIVSVEAWYGYRETEQRSVIIRRGD